VGGPGGDSPCVAPGGGGSGTGRPAPVSRRFFRFAPRSPPSARSKPIPPSLLARRREDRVDVHRDVRQAGNDGADLGGRFPIAVQELPGAAVASGGLDLEQIVGERANRLAERRRFDPESAAAGRLDRLLLPAPGPLERRAAASGFAATAPHRTDD